MKSSPWDMYFLLKNDFHGDVVLIIVTYFYKN